MANPRYLLESGAPDGYLEEDSSGVLLLEGVDDSDDNGWWSGGVNRSAVGVAITLASAALSVSVAIAGSFNHQDEIEAKIIGQSDSQQVIPVGDEPGGFVFQADEAIFPAAAPALDAGEWQPYAAAPAVVVAKVFSEQDERLPSVVDEDYNWQAQWVQASPAGRSPWADDDFVAQPVAFAPDELYWQVPTPALVPANAPLWATTEDELPRRAIVTDGESWQVFAIGDYPLGYALIADDDIVPIAGPGIDEVYWQQPVNPPVPLAAQPLSTTDEVVKTLALEADWQVWTPALIPPLAPVWLVGDDIVPQPLFKPEEDYWFQLRADPQEIVVIEWPGVGAGAGGSPPAAPLNIVESDWQVWTPPLVAAQPLYLPDPEQIPAGSLVGIQYGSQSVAAQNQRAFAGTEIVNWWQSDELPLFVPLNIVESDWQVWSPALAAAQPLFLPDPEQIPAGLNAAPIIEERDWQVWSPPFIAARPLFLPDPEQIPAGLIAPPLIEERDWQVWFPPLIAARGLYLPDPELIPAAFLRGVPNEDYWHTLKPIIPGPVVTVWTLDEFPLLSDPPIYGWGARSKVGSKTGRDPFQHIGSATAAAADKNVGSSSAKAQNGKIGSEDA